MNEYIYILENKDWRYENKFKFGYTKNPLQRIKDSHEQHSYLSTYYALYSIERTTKYALHFNEYDKIIYQLSPSRIEKYKKKYKYPFVNLASINSHLVKNGGSSEFIYKDGLEALEQAVLDEFAIVGLKATKIDVCDVNLEIKNYYDNYNKTLLYKDDISDSSDEDISDSEAIISPTYYTDTTVVCRKPSNIVLRTYQQELIDKIIQHIKNRCYLELPTGGGKSVIVYNVINIIKPKIVIIFSPRKIINKQNISKKYLDILELNYRVIDDTNDITDIIDITENTIIVSCVQSYKKIYNAITKYNLTNIFIWFDEAHWSLEGWVGDTDKHKEFLLKDEQHICWRLFTSASPDENIIREHSQIYGKLINDVSVRQLIDDNYLCSINPYIFSTKNDNPDILDYVLTNFEENKKSCGMSFHNNCDNAYLLFIKHYNHYIKGLTTIHPFLLISEYKGVNLDVIDAKILNYNYRDIKTFEKKENSIGYVVSQYSMGYDFNFIDIIFISDPKLSLKDIIQTIGRGMRPDMLGANGTNLYKVLHIYLPTYLEDDEDKKNKYKKIVEVLKYLLRHIKLTFDDIKFGRKKPKKDDDIYDEDANTEDVCDIYKGDEEVKAKLLDIIRTENKALWNTKKVLKHLSMYDIHNSQDYEHYSNKYIHLGLPEAPALFTNSTFKGFAWYNTYKEGECPYYNRIDCIKAVKKYIDRDEYYEIDDEDFKIEYLNKYDNRIPNTNLWRFYGGNRGDYF